MTVATYDRAKGQLTIEGHTGYGVKGQSILCAAVSILGYTAIEAANDHGGESVYRDGYVSVAGDDGLRRELDTVWRGLKLLAEEYPDYVQAKEA